MIVSPVHDPAFFPPITAVQSAAGNLFAEPVRFSANLALQRANRKIAQIAGFPGAPQTGAQEGDDITLPKTALPLTTLALFGAAAFAIFLLVR